MTIWKQFQKIVSLNQTINWQLFFFSSKSNCRTRAAQYKHTKQKNLKSPAKQLGLSRPNRTTRPNCPTTTWFRPEPKVQSVGDGFPFSKTDTGVSSGEFTSPKPVQPEPDRSYKKSGQILKKQARSGEISTRSSKISTRSGYIWWDLARSGQTQQFLAKKKNADFRKNQVSIENFPYSGKMF